MSQLPFIFNLVIYPDRDAALYDDVCRMPSKHRAERIRKLASLALVLPPLVGALDIRVPLPSTEGKEDPGADTSGNIDVKVTINSYTHHELYNDVAAIPKGHLSQRIKLLAEAGLIYQRLSGAILSGQHSGVVTEAVTTAVPTQTQPSKSQPSASTSVAMSDGGNGEQVGAQEYEEGLEEVDTTVEAAAEPAQKDTSTREPRRRSSFDGVKM